MTLPNGILVEYACDSASRVTGIAYKQGQTVLGNLTYEYDKAGNRTKVGGSFARTGIPQSVSSTNYNAANHQTTFGDKTLTYDNNGNLTSIVDASGTTLYTWNARNQLTDVSGPNVNASFVYDGLGRREKKTINGNLTEFLYDRLNPVQESSGATVTANILPGLRIDEFLARNDSGGIQNFLPDVLGSIVALADSAGSVQTEYTYEPFGGTTVTGVATSNPFQFTGRENDGTGVYYYRGRYFHPYLQRFASEDPIELYGGDSNRYVYVGNNPIRYIDPLGLHRKDPDDPDPPDPTEPPTPAKPPQPPEPPQPPKPCGNYPQWAYQMARGLTAASAAEMIHTGEILIHGGLLASGTGAGAAVGIPVAILGTCISIGGLVLGAEALGLTDFGLIPPPCH